MRLTALALLVSAPLGFLASPVHAQPLAPESQAVPSPGPEGQAPASPRPSPADAQPTPVPAPLPGPLPEAMPPAQPKPAPALSTLAIEGFLGLGQRLGSASSGYSIDQRGSWLLGAGLYYAPDRRFSFGLNYLYSQAGTEQLNATDTPSTGRITRRLDTALAQMRAYPYRTRSFGLWTGIGLGLTWQRASATGSYAQDDIAAAAKTYRRDVGPDTGIAMNAALGADFDLDTDLALLTSVQYTVYAISSDPLNHHSLPLIPGMGDTSQIDIRAAFQYRFDLLPGQKAPAQ